MHAIFYCAMKIIKEKSTSLTLAVADIFYRHKNAPRDKARMYTE